MITTKIMGGLGNQMFQYAAGKSLSLRLGVSLKLDVSYFRGQNLREYELIFFNIEEDIAYSHLQFPWGKKFLERMGLTSYYREKHFHYDANFESLGVPICLEGYWQSYKYFMAIDEVIKNVFVPKENSIDPELLEEVKSANVVSVHFRRGDYLSDDKTNSEHGVLESDYYHNAILTIKNNVPNPVFFVFSDEIEWVKKQSFFSDKAIYITGKKNYEDLYLMSLCRHNIIANSTFSWWGAWLNANPNKLVIAPHKWFNYIAASTDDLLPKNWLRV